MKKQLAAFLATLIFCVKSFAPTPVSVDELYMAADIFLGSSGNEKCDASKIQAPNGTCMLIRLNTWVDNTYFEPNLSSDSGCLTDAIPPGGGANGYQSNWIFGRTTNIYGGGDYRASENMISISNLRPNDGQNSSNPHGYCLRFKGVYTSTLHQKNMLPYWADTSKLQNSPCLLNLAISFGLTDDKSVYINSASVASTDGTCGNQFSIYAAPSSPVDGYPLLNVTVMCDGSKSTYASCKANYQKDS